MTIETKYNIGDEVYIPVEDGVIKTEITGANISILGNSINTEYSVKGGNKTYEEQYLFASEEEWDSMVDVFSDLPWVREKNGNAYSYRIHCCNCGWYIGNLTVKKAKEMTQHSKWGVYFWMSRTWGHFVCPICETKNAREEFYQK